MRKKYIAQICEAYGFQVDNDIADCCYATIEDLDENILTMIDSDDIHSWTPLGSKEFVEKFTKLYGGENVKPINAEISFGYDFETEGLIDF